MGGLLLGSIGGCIGVSARSRTRPAQGSAVPAERFSGGDAWGVGLGVNFVTEGMTCDASKYAGIQFRAKVSPNSGRNVRFELADHNTHKDGSIGPGQTFDLWIDDVTYLEWT